MWVCLFSKSCVWVKPRIANTVQQSCKAGLCFQQQVKRCKTFQKSLQTVWTVTLVFQFLYLCDGTTTRITTRELRAGTTTEYKLFPTAPFFLLCPLQCGLDGEQQLLPYMIIQMESCWRSIPIFEAKYEERGETDWNYWKRGWGIQEKVCRSTERHLCL